MQRVAIVILNYLNYKDTIDCIKSIEKMMYSICGIVVVDNGSNNNSIKMIKNICPQKNICFLRISENKGYAKGNNVGMKYARTKLKADYVLVVNNDTIFIQKDYIKKLLSAYKKGVGVIGGRIILQNGIQYQYIENFSIMDGFRRYINHLTMLRGCSFDIPLISDDYKHILHGCALMFTPDFFRFYQGFYPRTFLYNEEKILYLMCQIKGLKQVYVDDAEIFHKEDCSSMASFQNNNTTMMKYSVNSEKYALWWLVKYKVMKLLGKTE